MKMFCRVNGMTQGDGELLFAGQELVFQVGDRVVSKLLATFLQSGLIEDELRLVGAYRAALEIPLDVLGQIDEVIRDMEIPVSVRESCARLCFQEKLLQGCEYYECVSKCAKFVVKDLGLRRTKNEAEITIKRQQELIRHQRMLDAGVLNADKGLLRMKCGEIETVNGFQIDSVFLERMLVNSVVYSLVLSLAEHAEVDFKLFPELTELWCSTYDGVFVTSFGDVMFKPIFGRRREFLFVWEGNPREGPANLLELHWVRNPTSLD